MRLSTRSLASVCLLSLFTLVGAFAPTHTAEAQALGPVDGHDLPGTELERVAVGDEAPLFALDSFDGDAVELAGFRGEKNVVLVFYRGHW